MSFWDKFANIDMAVIYFLIGMVLGVLTAALSTFLVLRIIGRQVKPKPDKEPAPQVHRTAPAVQTRSESPRPEQPRPVLRVDTRPHPNIVIGKGGAVPSRPVPQVVTVSEVVEEEQPITEDTPVETPVSQRPQPRRTLGNQQFQYYVTGVEAPFSTLREAIAVFPGEAARYTDKHLQWDSLPRYVRENIKRVEITE